MTREQITCLMLMRQGFIKPVKEEEYEDLFRRMSPVLTLAWVEPGTAPQIGQRFEFDELEANNLARRMRTIVKGRFPGRQGRLCLSGRNAYVCCSL